jgi:hypothetical protein
MLPPAALLLLLPLLSVGAEDRTSQNENNLVHRLHGLR